MAVATVERLSFAYPGGAPALRDVSLELRAGETVALLGPSGSGKSTLLRALAGLVPHFHGGRFSGRAVVGGRDTRTTRPAELTGAVASVFQDPEDQVVMTRAANEVAFGLENMGVPPAEIWRRVEEAFADVGASHLHARRTDELSGGELQRVCLAGALALRPSLLLLDEPTSQLDPEAADRFVERTAASGATTVISEQRVDRVLACADRVLFMEEGRLLLDADYGEATAWLHERRPAYAGGSPVECAPSETGRIVVSMENISYSYAAGRTALVAASLVVRRGEIVAVEGPNGSGKTTLAKIAAGLLEPGGGHVGRFGSVGYVSQDPGRYVVCERVGDEVALAVGGDAARARRALADVDLGWAWDRHPRDLSSGERERLALASVAVAEPDLLVLDEPTRGVDPDRKQELARWLAAYARAGRGVLVMTHDRTFPAHRRVELARRPEGLVAV